MAIPVGIELSSSACRIVEIEARPAWRVKPGNTRVRSLTVLPASGSATQAHFASLRGRPVAVVVWGAESIYRQVMVTDGSYEAMRVEGVASLAKAGLDIPGGAWSDIALAPHGAGSPVRRPVVVALASGSVLSSAVQPLIDAGIRVRTVMTPAMALGSLARLRRSASASGAAEAYVAVEEGASCVALVRDGALMAARDLSWGYLVERDGIGGLRTREDVASRLADEIREFIADVGGSVSAVAQVTVCGGLPELRSMAAQLVERLDVEVEPLDSLFGIDEAHVSADAFRDRGAELRLAWAAAADWPPAHNLLRARRRAASHAILARAAVITGIAAGLAVGVDVAGRSWWQAVEPLLMARANPARVEAVLATRRSGAGARAVSTQWDVRPHGETAAAAPPVVPARPPVRPPPPVALVAAREPEPEVEHLAMTEAPRVRLTPRSPVSAPAHRALPAGHARPARTPTPHPPVSGVPLDAAVASILYAPDRRLAIIDGRIVSAGDEVRGARVVEIAPGLVLLRDPRGRLRRLALGVNGP